MRITGLLPRQQLKKNAYRQATVHLNLNQSLVKITVNIVFICVKYAVCAFTHF